jgi:hypothetical protein
MPYFPDAGASRSSQNHIGTSSVAVMVFEMKQIVEEFNKSQQDVQVTQTTLAWGEPFTPRFIQLWSRARLLT